MKEKIRNLVGSKTVIHIKTHEQLIELNKVVRELGLLPISDDYEQAINRGDFCVHIMRICAYCERDYYLNQGYKIIEFEELCKNNTIVIYQKGNEVIALDKRTGKKAVAKCNPRDTFDFDTGAKLAFERLTGVIPFEPKKELKVGDRVVIRQWDDMVKEFGENCNGFINCNSTFTTRMRPLCGRTATIIDIGENHKLKLDFDDKSGDTNWGYSTDMVEVLNEEYFTGKMVCVRSCNNDYTVGKIYEVVNGKLKDNDGESRPRGYSLKNPSDYTNRSCYEFIEVVE